MTRPLSATLTNLIAPYRSPRYFHVLTIVENAFAKHLPRASKINARSGASRSPCCCGVRGWPLAHSGRVSLVAPQAELSARALSHQAAMADDVVSRAVAAGLSVRDAVGDTHCSADWFTKRLARLGLIWHCTLYLKTSVETRA
jgi:hypothetical protein